MNDPSAQKPSIYPILLLAALSTVALFDPRSPLDSLRPEPGIREDSVKSREIKTKGMTAVHQRIWDDPFKDVWFTDLGSRTVTSISDIPPTTQEEVTSKMHIELPTNCKKLLILPVIISDANTTRAAEDRIRRRYAIHQALSVAGYRGSHPDHIVACDLGDNFRVAIETFSKDGLSKAWIDKEKFDVAWPLEAKTRTQSESDPYFKSSDFAESSDFDSVSVVYVRGSRMNSETLTGLDTLVTRLPNLYHKDKQSKLKSIIRIIGPQDSGQIIDILKTMKELKVLKQCAATFKSAQPYILSPFATADYQTLKVQGNLKDIDFLTESMNASRSKRIESVHEERQDLYESASLRFIRTIHADSSVLEGVVEELKVRRLIESVEDLKKVALIVESDTQYGRSMPANFTLGAIRALQPDTNAETSFWKSSFQWIRSLWEKKEKEKIPFKTQLANLQVFSYVSGLDGDRSVKTSESSAKGEPTSGDLAAVAPEKNWSDPIAHGNHQIDYVRRLAETIAARAKGDNPIRVVGILGNDVYDKLLLLRALKPILGDVAFFTTDLDARLWHSSEIEFSRNLIVGSSYGLELNDSFEGIVAPFRDSYQTSLFATTLLAVNHLNIPYEIEKYDPQVFEIGMNGPVNLPRQQVDRALAENEQPTKPLFSKKDTDSLPRWICFWSVITILCMALAVAYAWNQTRGTLSESSKALINSNYKTLCLWILLVIVCVGGLLLQVAPNELEPLSLFDGVSAWPGFFLNLFNAVLAVSMSTHIGCTRVEAARRALSYGSQLKLVEEPNKRSFKNSPFVLFGALLLASLLYGLLMENAHSAQAVYLLSSFSIALGVALAWCLWCDLDKMMKSAKSKKKELILDRPLSTFVRTFLLPFFFFTVLVSMWAIGTKYNYLPIRSIAFQTAFGLSQLIQIVSMLTLLSYVVYESVWVTALVRGMSRRVEGRICWDIDKILNWTDEEKERRRLLNKLSRPGDVNRTHDEASKIAIAEADLLQVGARCVDITSRITEIPNRYLVYPFVVLMVWFLGQNNDFEGWGWSQHRWISAFCLFVICLLPTLILRISAMRLRARVIQQLNHVQTSELFVQSVHSGKHSPSDFAQRLNSIKRGAYAPMLNQPAILALLTPMGGLGSLALIKLFFTHVV